MPERDKVCTNTNNSTMKGVLQRMHCHCLHTTTYGNTATPVQGTFVDSFFPRETARLGVGSHAYARELPNPTQFGSSAPNLRQSTTAQLSPNRRLPNLIKFHPHQLGPSVAGFHSNTNTTTSQPQPTQLNSNRPNLFKLLCFSVGGALSLKRHLTPIKKKHRRTHREYSSIVSIHNYVLSISPRF